MTYIVCRILFVIRLTTRTHQIKHNADKRYAEHQWRLYQWSRWTAVPTLHHNLYVSTQKANIFRKSIIVTDKTNRLAVIKKLSITCVCLDFTEWSYSE